MDNLPSKILKRILEHVPEEELASMKQVCQTWRDIIDLELGIPLYLGNGNECYWLDGVEWSPFKKISEVGISRAFFSEIQEGFPALGFKSPDLVKEASFDGFVSGSSFSRLISQLPNLQIVKIHTSTLCYLQSPDLREWNLPLLRDLHIVSYGTDHHDSWAHMNDQIMDSTDVILRSNRFPRLKNLKLNMLFVPTREKELTNAILECVAAHKSTLRTLGMEYKYEGESNDEDPMTFDAEDSSRWMAKLCGLKLDKFSLQFYYDGAPRTEFWREFLSNQNGLCTIDYICGNGLLPFPTSVVEQNSQSLGQIHLKVHILGDEFDCSVFQDCHLLRTLGLVNKSSEILFECEHDLSNVKYPRLINVHRLPKTLKNVLLGYFQVTSADTKILAFEFPELQELCLSVVGRNDGCGMEVLDMLKLLEQKKLRRLTILEGVNEDSVENLDGDDSTTRAMRLIMNVCGTNIDCQLNEMGYYDPCPIDDYI